MVPHIVLFLPKRSKKQPKIGIIRLMQAKETISVPVVRLTTEMVGRLEDYLRWFNDPEVRTGLFSTTPTDATGIEKWLKSLEGNPTKFYQFISVDRQAIGHIGLNDIDHATESAEVGLVIGEKQFWGKGIGSRVLEDVKQTAK